MTTSYNDSTTEGATRVEVDVDHHSPEFRERPLEILANLRSKCPVAHSNEHGGFWMFTDYANVYEASREDDLFRSAETVGVPSSGMPFPILPIESDPPHTLAGDYERFHDAGEVYAVRNLPIRFTRGRRSDAS